VSTATPSRPDYFGRGRDAEALRVLGRERLGTILEDERLFAGFFELLAMGLNPGCKSRSLRTEAMRLYYAAAKECGGEKSTQLAVQIFASIGAVSEVDARRKISIVNDAESKSPEQQIDDAAAWLERLLTDTPHLREHAAECLARVLHAAPQLEAHVNGKSET
jgi:hypothetical protein